MEQFGFIIHPLDAKRDVMRKYAAARILPAPVIEWGLRFIKPVLVSHITGVRSLTGAEAEGWFVGCPLTPRQQLQLPLETVYEKIALAGAIAVEQGAKIVGLGAFTSVVGDGGVSVAKRLPVPVTTGNSYTVATAIEGTVAAGEEIGIDVSRATLSVIGAGGSIGRTCALILGERVSEVVLIGGKNRERVEAVKREAERRNIKARVADNIASALRDSDLVISVSSADRAIIEPGWLKSGSVVCDVARPRDVGPEVIRQRQDVLVIEGGVVKAPGNVDFGFDFGFEPGTAFACMSETMMLALEGRYESFTLGKEVSDQKVREINDLARKHGFRLAGFRSFERPITRERIDEVRRSSGRRGRTIVTGG